MLNLIVINSICNHTWFDGNMYLVLFPGTHSGFEKSSGGFPERSAPISDSCCPTAFPKKRCQPTAISNSLVVQQLIQNHIVVMDNYIVLGYFGSVLADEGLAQFGNYKRIKEGITFQGGNDEQTKLQIEKANFSPWYMTLKMNAVIMRHGSHAYLFYRFLNSEYLQGLVGNVKDVIISLRNWFTKKVQIAQDTIYMQVKSLYDRIALFMERNRIQDVRLSQILRFFALIEACLESANQRLWDTVKSILEGVINLLNWLVPWLRDIGLLDLIGFLQEMKFAGLWLYVTYMQKSPANI
jgi:hypothetical protein